MKIYDKQTDKATNSLEEVVLDSDFIFISVPTPMKQDGSISLNIIYDVFKEIDSVLDYEAEKQPILLLRSTVQ